MPGRIGCLRSGYDLRAATPWFFLIASIGGDTIEDDRHSDHPLGAHACWQNRQILLTQDPQRARALDQTIRELAAKIPR